MRSAAAAGGYREVLARRDFAMLWAGQSLSNIGNRMFPVALAMLVLRRGGGATDLGLVLGARSLATLVGSLLAVALGDRWRRTRVMISADLVRTAAVSTLAFGTGAGLAPLIATVFAVGVGDGLFLPAFGAVMPRIVPARSLQAGNALNQATKQASALLGPALAGLLVASTSPQAALWVDAATFVFSLVSLTLIVEPRAAPAELVTGIRGALVEAAADLRAGVRAVTDRSWVASSIGMATVLMTLVVPPAFVVLALITDDRLGGPRGYGAVLAALGLGSMLGALVMGRLQTRRPGVVATAGLFAITGMLVSVAYLPLAAIVVCWALAGAGMGIYNLLWLTALQRDVPDELLGRVLALDALGSDAFEPIGYVLAGPAVALLGAHSVLVAGALVVAVVAPLPLLVRGGPTFRTPRGDWSDERSRAAPASTVTGRE